jgi:hypothetical protein
VKSAMVLASAREDTEDELVVEGRAREMYEREHRARFEEHMLLQAQGSELCHAIVGPPWANICLRGCGLPPSIILKWQWNSPRFGWRCPLRQSQCSGALSAILPVQW